MNLIKHGAIKKMGFKEFLGEVTGGIKRHNYDYQEKKSIERELEDESDQISENNSSLSIAAENKKVISTKTIDTSDYLVTFSGLTKSYCVGVVDIVDSTKICSDLQMMKVCRYYEIFLNSMAEILRHFGGTIVKNVGDSLLYYFPESAKSGRRYGFISCLECSLAMIEAHPQINKISNEEKLPQINYRVSSDYGNVLIMKTKDFDSIDIFGPPVNMCSKINHVAPKNTAVIGGDLYQVVRHFEDYNFNFVKDCPIGLKYSYPVYSITAKY